MPRLIRLYITQIIIGCGLSVCFVTLLLGFNVANLRHLVTTSPDGWLAVGILLLSNATVFSGAQFGIAVMRLGQENDDGGSGRAEARRAWQYDAIPLRVSHRRNRR